MIMGFLQWFPLGNRKLVEDTVRDLHAIGCPYLRTGFSWADWEWDSRENEAGMTGKEWYAWLYPYLKDQGIDILPNFLYTPLHRARPDSKGERRTSHPPQNISDYAAFIKEAIEAHGDCFEYVELLNEPHLKQEWNPELDPDFSIYVNMVREAAAAARSLGKKTVLSGPTAHHVDWLEDRAKQGIMENIDVVGFHAFQFCKWGEKHSNRSITDYARDIRARMEPFGFTGEVWLTETGYPTAGEEDVNEDRQAEIFRNLLSQSEIERVYWWSLRDLHPELQSYTESQIGFREDSFYHFGIKTHDGRPKALYNYLYNKESELKTAA